MSAAIPWSWPLVVSLAVVWVVVALHAALAMRRFRRRWWVWFALSVFLTVIPAVVCSYVEYFRELRRRRRASEAGSRRPQRDAPGRDSVQPGARRCRHCAALLTGAADDAASPASQAAPDKPPEPAGRATCPHCGMAVEDEYLA